MITIDDSWCDPIKELFFPYKSITMISFAFCFEEGLDYSSGESSTIGDGLLIKYNATKESILMAKPITAINIMLSQNGSYVT